jgi:hypothetical protein
MPSDGIVTITSDGKFSLKNGVLDICDECCGDCFSSCQQTPTNSPTCGTLVPGICGATIPSLYDVAPSYTDAVSYHVWTWEGDIFDTPSLNFILEVRCQVSDQQVGARSLTSVTNPDMGGNDSAWAGFKDITGNLSCGGDGNLSGSFSLEGLDGGCEADIATFTL